MAIEEKITELVDASNALTLAAEKVINDASESLERINDLAETITDTFSAIDFEKATPREVAFKSENGTVKAKCNLKISVNSVAYQYPEGTVVDTPPLNGFGIDYAIYATENGLIASENFTKPDGYTEENSRRIAGFHLQNGEINNNTFWDLKYRPKCIDPRGMIVGIGEDLCADIYLLNDSPDALGTSAYGATIADGSNPPKVPAFWGGDNLTQYDNFNWYTASQLFAAYGKRMPTVREFVVLANGALANSKAGTDPITTKFTTNETSTFGCEQVSGHMWQWGEDRSSNIAVRLGGDWAYSSPGPLVSYWGTAPSYSVGGVGARGVCDLLILL